MTLKVIPKSGPVSCHWCHHDLDQHELWLVLQETPGGIVTCPASDCSCLATWGAVLSRSTPAQRVHLRDQVAAELRAQGLVDLSDRVRRLGA